MSDDSQNRAPDPSQDDEEKSSESMYNHKVLDGMSGVEKAVAEDFASEDEKTVPRPVVDPDDDPEAEEDDFSTPISKDPHAADHGSGEDDAAGGSASDPDSDNDVGSMMARVMGEDPDPNMDNPQELGIGDAIDRDEEAIRES